MIEELQQKEREKQKKLEQKREEEEKRKLLRKKLVIIILTCVVILGAFLRFYNFSDWMHFELDQARDAKVVDQALEEGWLSLPLQGPRAAGSFLRLGPAFYYLQYLSALVFGDSPAGMAAFIGILGVATILLFYFFVRRYFGRKISLFLSLLFAISLFHVMYSRFSWNPNPLPFFILLGFYALLISVEKEKITKTPWFLISAFSLGIATQLHFVAFLSLPLIAGIFLLFKRPKLEWKAWLGGAIIILLLYLPVILNDIKTGGANFKEFDKTLTERSEKNNHNFPEKVIKAYNQIALGNFLVTSGWEEAEFFTSRPLGKIRFDILCDQSCRNNLHWGILAIILLLVGVVYLVVTLLKEMRYIRYKEKYRDNLLEVELKKGGFSQKGDYFDIELENSTPHSIFQEDFLHLITIWFIVIFVVFIPIAFDIAPRFFLITLPLAFVFLGFILEILFIRFLKKRQSLKKYVWFSLIIILGLFFLGSNIWNIYFRFSELRQAPFESIKIDSDRILKEKTRVTYEQQQMIIDYIQDFYQKNGGAIYMHADAEYRRAFVYLMNKREIQNDHLKISTIYRKGNYFLIFRSQADLESRTKKYRELYDFQEEKQFGTLTVFYMRPKEEAITHEAQDFSIPEVKGPSRAPMRYMWRDIFK